MRVPPEEYLHLDLRAHDLLRAVPVHDVTVVDLPGGGDGRRLADIRALESTAPPSRASAALFGLRRLLGRALGWDGAPIRPDDSLLPRLSDADRRASEVAPGTFVGPFLLLYQFPREALLETRNATVHGFVAMTLGAHRHRLSSLLGRPRAARLLADAAVPDGDRALPPLHRVSGTAGADPSRLGGRLPAVAADPSPCARSSAGHPPPSAR